MDIIMAFPAARVDHREPHLAELPGRGRADPGPFYVFRRGGAPAVPPLARLRLAERATHHRHLVFFRIGSRAVDVLSALRGVMRKDLRVVYALAAVEIYRTGRLADP